MNYVDFFIVSNFKVKYDEPIKSHWSVQWLMLLGVCYEFLEQMMNLLYVQEK